MRAFIAFAFAMTAAHAIAATDSLSLSRAQIDHLTALVPGAQFVLDEFPDGFGGHASLRFVRIDVYTPNARLIVVDADGEHALQRSRRIQLIGSSADGSVRSSLSFDPGFTNINGVGAAPSGAFVITGTGDADSVRLRVLPAADALPAGVVPQIVPSDDALPSGRAMPDALALSLIGSAPAVTARGAVVAIDTDNEFMSKRFANNMAAAADWITDLFGAMNVMYQRDLNVILQQGTTYLRIATDPYTQTGTPANQAELTEFGTYWQSHYGSVARSFAALLSGKSSSGNSASGIAWINAYCETAAQGGSYSVEQVFTNAQVPLSYSALIVGHEIGHNFGAYHTHCTNAANGSAPTASNTIDKCYSGETGCYSGATGCPTTGPGAPAGTVMSYCNLQGCNGGANVLQFHPTQIGVLSTLIAQNTPSCLNPNADAIFLNGFD